MEYYLATKKSELFFIHAATWMHPSQMYFATKATCCVIPFL